MSPFFKGLLKNQIMKKSFVLVNILFLFVISALLPCQVGALETFNVERFVLDNGFTVYLNVDTTVPEVFGCVMVKAGSKDDPEGGTGMAHYMEHMLFKGTTELGTIDWKKEKPYIDKTFALYDELAATKEDAARQRIQKEINAVSLEAGKYAIPNEFDNVLNSIGGTNMNAATGPDDTIFYNAFPPTQMEKWLELYSHRFIEPVFRGFQAELEVVYEEKNMYADEFINALIQKFDEKFFKNHPYGQKDPIGTIEELKNPSLTKMYTFFKDWYVANNMALVLSGNFDAEAVKPMIRKKFGKLNRGTLPERTVYEEQPFNGREFYKDKLSPIEMGLLGFRTVPTGHPHELALTVCDRILSNVNETGLLDRLSLDGELLAATSLFIPLQDHGQTIFIFYPNMPEQKLEDAEQLVMAELARLKRGEFEDWMLDAIKNELYVEHQKSLESPEDKALSIATYFAEGRDVQELMTYADRIRKVTKEQVLDVARKYYGDNYLAFYSKEGSPEKDTIDKPGFDPVIANTSAKSPFTQRFERMKVLDAEIEYVDFDKDVQYGFLQDKVALYTTRNPVNDIFSLIVRYGVGEHAMPMLEYATQLMNYSGARDQDVAAFKKEFSKLGCGYEIWSGEDYAYLEVEGLEENFEKAMQLIRALLDAPNVDPEKLDIIVQQEEAVREIERSEPDTVADALFEYVRYKEKSSYLDRLTLKEIKALNTDSLVADFKKAITFETEIHYVGTMGRDKVQAILKEILKFPKTLTATESPVILDPAGYDENTVFFVNKKNATQSKIYLYTKGMKHDLAKVPQIDAFNMYFDGGFSGLMLQEIREYRSLAYTASAFYSTPEKEGAKTEFFGYVGTQADKTLDALEVLYGLIREMPQKKDRMENIRTYLVQSALTAKPSFRDLSVFISDWKTEGYTDDPRKKQVPVYEKMSFEDIVTFYQENIKEKPIVFSFVGDKKRIDMKELKKYGKIVKVKEKSLFN